MRTRFPLLAAIWLTALAGFVVLAVFAASNDTFPSDVWLAQRIQDIDSPAVDRALDWTEDLGDLPLFAVVCAGAALAIALTGDRFGALLLLLSTAGRALNNWAIKVAVERPRPSAELVDFNDQPSSFSFPSGHAESTFVLYGLIFYFATLHIQNLWSRRVIQAACVTIIAGNGIQRVFAGDHWPSDVLGGFYLGALVLSVAIAVHRLAPSLKFEVTSGRPLRFHVRRHSPEQGFGRPRET